MAGSVAGGFNEPGAVEAELGFVTRASLELARALGERVVDYRGRLPSPLQYERVRCRIDDARAATICLQDAGFELVSHGSAVQDWYDPAEVTARYYEECRALACELTGARHAFTFDHLIREPGRQLAGGGVPARGAIAQDMHITGIEHGGGYVGGVHMDYVEGEAWAPYLALHGEAVPNDVRRTVVLNMWRPISPSVDAQPLAVCDGRTVSADDVLRTRILGYGHPSYSWHAIGVSVYELAHSERQHWYWYPRMTPSDVLVMRTFDSEGVIGRAPPHASFANPMDAAAHGPRRSIELRVLCFIV
jgi:hypothetical protein